MRRERLELQSFTPVIYFIFIYFRLIPRSFTLLLMKPAAFVFSFFPVTPLFAILSMFMREWISLFPGKMAASGLVWNDQTKRERTGRLREEKENSLNLLPGPEEGWLMSLMASRVFAGTKKPTMSLIGYTCNCSSRCTFRLRASIQVEVNFVK